MGYETVEGRERLDWPGVSPAPDSGDLGAVEGFELTPENRRRPDAIAGPKVRLLDGREWEVPAVRIEIAESDEREDGIAYVTNVGPDFDEALMSYEEAEDGVARNRYSLKMCGELLRRNYRLSVRETGRLIRWRAYKVDGEDGDPLYRELTAAALGTERPKPSGAGSPSHSGSPG